MNRPKALPTINWLGQIYYIDFRLREARPVNRPYESIGFSAMTENMKKEIRGIRTRLTQYGYINGLDD